MVVAQHSDFPHDFDAYAVSLLLSFTKQSFVIVLLLAFIASSFLIVFSFKTLVLDLFLASSRVTQAENQSANHEADDTESTYDCHD